MQFSVIFSGFALSSLVIAQDPMGACAKGVHLIAAAGANNTDPTALSRFAPTVQAITAAIPGSDAVSLPYDKAEPRLNHLSPDAIPNGVSPDSFSDFRHRSCRLTRRSRSQPSRTTSPSTTPHALTPRLSSLDTRPAPSSP